MEKLILFLFSFIISIKSFAQVSGTLIDLRDGKSYQTVKIANQTWMAENLAYFVDKACWAYENNSDRISKYGYLYTGQVANQVCPPGWHLPTQLDFDSLLINISSVGEQEYLSFLRGEYSGFPIKFGGYRDKNGIYNLLGEYTAFWTCCRYLGGTAWYLGIDGKKLVGRVHSIDRSFGFSVRCIKND
jgi:uncharacterized protein (TIGR02145 family)